MVDTVGRLRRDMGIALASLSTGTPALSLPQLYNALSVPVRAEVAHVIVWDLRLPRLLLATMAGAMLAVAGLLCRRRCTTH